MGYFKIILFGSFLCNGVQVNSYWLLGILFKFLSHFKVRHKVRNAINLKM